MKKIILFVLLMMISIYAQWIPQWYGKKVIIVADSVVWKCDILPDADSLRSLGSQNLRFKSIYGTMYVVDSAVYISGLDIYGRDTVWINKSNDDWGEYIPIQVRGKGALGMLIDSTFPSWHYVANVKSAEYGSNAGFWARCFGKDLYGPVGFKAELDNKSIGMFIHGYDGEDTTSVGILDDCSKGIIFGGFPGGQGDWKTGLSMYGLTDYSYNGTWKRIWDSEKNVIDIDTLKSLVFKIDNSKLTGLIDSSLYLSITGDVDDGIYVHTSGDVAIRAHSSDTCGVYADAVDFGIYSKSDNKFAGYFLSQKTPVGVYMVSDKSYDDTLVVFGMGQSWGESRVNKSYIDTTGAYVVIDGIKVAKDKIVDTDSMELQGGVRFSNQFWSPINVVPYNTTTNVYWDSSNVQTITLTGNTTIEMLNGKSGARYVLIIKQDGTGGRNITWDSDCKFPGGVTPILSTSANAVDLLEFVCDGTNYYCVNAMMDLK